MKKEQGCSRVSSAALQTVSGEMMQETASVVHENASGKDVLQEVVQMTGLPEDYLHAEINSFLGTNHGCERTDVKNLSLDQLRSVLLNYLETLNEEMTQEQIKH